ncbi:MAG: phosphoribosylaminoimidazolesuccinocarboxamide synthase [Elusimicrobiota bacterium]
MNKMVLPIFRQGKVRDVYDLGDLGEELLIISTDRISAFDFVLPTLIPGKGKILNQLSLFWFKFLENVIPNHLLIDKVQNFPLSLRQYDQDLEKRSVIVKKARRINIECVVRGYLAGSAWKEYQQYGTVCGVKLPSGLKESDKLPEPMFTPATKAEMGDHDINITEQQLINNEGEKVALFLKEKSLQIYKKAGEYAFSRGIIIADTKFEFGFYPPDSDKIILIDEVLTPDSSRFWDQKKYVSGESQDSFDKQFVRDYLESIHWNKYPPVPELPEQLVQKTYEKYLDAYKRLTGRSSL